MVHVLRTPVDEESSLHLSARVAQSACHNIIGISSGIRCGSLPFPCCRHHLPRRASIGQPGTFTSYMLRPPAWPLTSPWSHALATYGIALEVRAGNFRERSQKLIGN